MRRSATKPSAACVRCWCSEQTPETSAMCMCPYTTLNKFRSSNYHLITCYRNLFVHLIFQRWRDSRRKKNKESVLRSACSWRPNSNLLLGETRTLVTMGNQSICELMHRMNMYKALSLSISPPRWPHTAVVLHRESALHVCSIAVAQAAC